MNKRTRSLHPVVVQRQGLVTTLRQLLGDLGLERRTRDVESLEAYLHSRTPSPPPPSAAHVDTTPAPPGEADAAACNDEATT